MFFSSYLFKMTKLKVFYNNWNERQQAYYKVTLEDLLSNKITSDSELLQMDFNALCKIVKVPRQVIRAFMKQVAVDVVKQEQLDDIDTTSVTEEKSTPAYLPTGLESLDKMLLHGFQFGQIIELCGESIKGKIKLLSSLLVSYVTTYQIEGVYVFNSTGILEPKPMSEHYDLSSIWIQIEITQTFSLQSLVQSLENLAALLSSYQEYPCLIIIDDPSKLIEQDWSSSLVRILRVLSRKLDCCIVLLHHTSSDALVTSNSTTEIWKTAIDLRLDFISEETIQLTETQNEV
ncbi:uncharacterized protein BX663DRAFT_544204 [Cokeromyces recurvatus]|uniref:uncharacterized protein n=1 Tax=Cokeromyces recurvatus TaxID=90255 RepID=UPI00221F33F8|nr:uncharacterized protein BX663DRAFT_544204 [Cokeromyces recurvatus]KAI7901457.1 hypothetical protein BX663DRAFT_544204 [Cokeromyces recurvatus]